MNKTEKIEAVKHVAISIRISDEKKIKGKRVSEEETLKNHKERLIEFCKRKGYTYEIFQEVVSGGKTDIDDRKELQKMLNRLNEFDAIVVTEISRLSRDMSISSLIERKMIDYDKLIMTPEHTYYLKDETDALMYGIGSVISSHERKIIGKRIKFNKLEMARQGLNASGSVPLGYKRNPNTKRLEIDEKTAHIPATAFYLNSLGYGSLRIKDILNDLGFKTANNRFWVNQTVKDLLNKPTYKGFTVYHDYETIIALDKDNKEVKKRKVKDTIIIPNTHDPIVSPEMFDKLEKQRAKRNVSLNESATRNRSNTIRKPSILKDFLYCNSCGRKKKISFDPKYDVWLIRNCGVDASLADGSRCTDNGFKARAIEAEVLKLIFEHEKKLQKEIDLLLNNDHKKMDADNIKLKNQLEKELNEKIKEAEQLANIQIDLMLKGNQTMIQTIEKRMNENEAIQNTLQQQLKKISEKLEAPKAEEEIKERLNVIDVIKKIRKENDPEKINNFLKHFIFKIHYSRSIPIEIAKLGTTSPLRNEIKPEIEIEYI